ncbi:MAG: HNH endonuclease [Nitrospirae bacterium]|nr:MAG: HNH endonuclease [Nitrospirota bacterium]
MCGEFIELDLPARDSLAFSIDHIIPLSKGGDDIFSNVRATHYSCNSRRGNRE